MCFILYKFKYVFNTTGTGMTIPYWDFMGSTMVTNNYIRLTPDLQSKQGALWNSVVSNCLYFAYICVNLDAKYKYKNNIYILFLLRFYL